MNERANYNCFDEEGHKCHLNQCNAKFKLGVEEFAYDDKGALQQKGFRYEIDKCFTIELSKYIEYLSFFWSFERFGLPFNCGWAEMPSQLFQILNVLKIESQYMRKK